MSSMGYYEIVEIHKKEIGCGFCKFKNPYGWVCDNLFSPMRGQAICPKVSCPSFKRKTANQIR